mmetsp:Transcript_58892/g.138473  ORF Transcript_58892/g.138473 Transcript_58892/m.138473 type:complete len:230 (-) Transcript_58892:310-999(-)
MPFMSPSARRLTSAQISSYVVSFLSLQVRSTTDTSMVGTRKAMPVSLPLTSGITLATALAAPVDEGMMLPEAARPPRQSLRDEESTTAWVAVMAWMVVMRPSSMPNLSLMHLTRGARPLVVHEAHDTKSVWPLYSSGFTPITTVRESSLAGAENTTFLQPPSMCAWAFSEVRKTPVDSQRYSTPVLPHPMSFGSRWRVVITRWPSRTRSSPSTTTEPSKRPWMESYLNW